jgi:hypothetical protein
VTNKELIKFLRDNKDNPAFGGGDFDYREAWNRFARKYSDLGFTENPEPFVINWRDYADYFIHVGSKAVLRPAGALVSIFILVFIGWVAAVNVSLASVPGDFLYPVKLATERTQLILTATSEQRARLHAEFAGRRLDEAMEIAASARSDSEKDALMKTVVENFKVEVASVTDELENVSSTERAQTVTELAEAVGRRAEEYSAVLGQSSGKVSEEAAAAVVEIQEKVTETVVSEHEQQPQKETAKYLDTAFQKDILEINNRIDMVNLRLSRIETTLSNSGALTVDISNTIKIVRAAVKDFNAEINELSKIFAAGGYRTVFEKISEMKTVLTNAEGIAADLEINLTSPQE